MPNGDQRDDTSRSDTPAAATQISLKVAIVRAAIELGTELGEEGLTMRGIAARLGVSATALYQHFEGKASILRAIRFHGLGIMNAALAPAFDQPEPIDQLRQVALLYINFARSNSWLYGLLFQGEDLNYASLDEEEQKATQFLRGRIEATFESGKAKGQLRPDINVAIGPLLMWAANHGLAMLLISGRINEQPTSSPVANEDEFIATFVEAEIRGLTST